MALESKDKTLLNKFAESQPALNDNINPRGQSEVKLGDLLDEAHGAIRTLTTTYNAKRDGGTAGETYILNAAKVPAGAIITRGWLAANVDLVSGGAATFDVTVGATSLSGGAKAYTAVTGAGGPQESKADLLATLPEASSGGKPKIAIAGANVTDGELMITLEYIYPVS